MCVTRPFSGRRRLTSGTSVLRNSVRCFENDYTTTQVIAAVAITVVITGTI